MYDLDQRLEIQRKIRYLQDFNERVRQFAVEFRDYLRQQESLREREERLDREAAASIPKLNSSGVPREGFNPWDQAVAQVQSEEDALAVERNKLADDLDDDDEELPPGMVRGPFNLTKKQRQALQGYPGPRARSSEDLPPLSERAQKLFDEYMNSQVDAAYAVADQYKRTSESYQRGEYGPMAKQAGTFYASMNIAAQEELTAPLAAANPVMGLVHLAGQGAAALLNKLDPQGAEDGRRAGPLAAMAGDVLTTVGTVGAVGMVKAAGSFVRRSTFSAAKPWKRLIVGAAQKTGTPGHRFRVSREAIKMAKSGAYERVFMNRSYATATGVKTTPKRLPDVLGKRTTGQFDAVEVMSKTDEAEALLSRNIEAMNQLPAEKRGRVFVYDILKEEQ